MQVDSANVTQVSWHCFWVNQLYLYRTVSVGLTSYCDSGGDNGVWEIVSSPINALFVRSCPAFQMFCSEGLLF